MNKDYIIKGNTTYIADQSGLHQRPTSSQIVKIMKLENDIETLKIFLKKYKSKLESAKSKRKNYFKAILASLGTGILFAPIVTFLTEVPILLTSAVTVTELLEEIWPLFQVFAAISLSVGSLMSICNIPSFLLSKKEIVKQEKLVAYLESKVTHAEESLTKVKQQNKLSSNINENKINSLDAYNRQFSSSLERRLTLIESLTAIRDNLSERKKKRHLENLNREGYTNKEIQEAQTEMGKVLKFEPIDSQAKSA